MRPQLDFSSRAGTGILLFHHFDHTHIYSLGKIAEAAYYRIVHFEPSDKGYNYSLVEHVCSFTQCDQLFESVSTM